MRNYQQRCKQLAREQHQPSRQELTSPASSPLGLSACSASWCLPSRMQHCASRYLLWGSLELPESRHEDGVQLWKRLDMIALLCSILLHATPPL